MIPPSSSRAIRALAAGLLVVPLLAACGGDGASTPQTPETGTGPAAAPPATDASTAAPESPAAQEPAADPGAGGAMLTVKDLETLDPCSLITAEQWSAALVDGGYQDAPIEMTDDGGYVEGLGERQCILSAVGSGLPLEMWSLRFFEIDPQEGTPRPDLPGEAREVSDSIVHYKFGEVTLAFHNFPLIPQTAKLYEAAVASYQSR